MTRFKMNYLYIPYLGQMCPGSPCTARTRHFTLFRAVSVPLTTCIDFSVSGCVLIGEPGNSVRIVSGYGLDDRANEVRFPAGQRIFPLSSASRPALGPIQPPVQWVPGVLSPGAKRGRDVTLTTHPYIVPRSRMSRSYTSSAPKRPRGVWWGSFGFRVCTYWERRQQRFLLNKYNFSIKNSVSI
jgi:hypothetical protein